MQKNIKMLGHDPTLLLDFYNFKSQGNKNAFYKRCI